MHELTICQSLLSEISRIAAQHGARAVTEIVVAVGPLSGVEPKLLERAFSVAQSGTIADRATLVFEETTVVVWCRDCQRETPVAANALLCGECGTWRVELRSGDEMILKRLELADIAEGAAAA
ncbi:MAG TPA: hydrogenase maturation nickel metallochaperone HypA [Rhizomicrobium sp.]|nr:hydrogenase maturation nickel metallochaperone HypA [Rhizomicrobium sp.]